MALDERPLFNARGMLAALAWSTLLLGGCGCNDPALLEPPPAPTVNDTDAGPPDGGRGFPDGSGIGRDELLVSRIEPAHGPFVGGNQALVRGAGFTPESFVYVGGRLVQPADTDVRGPNRIAVILPAGDVGPADVTVEVGDKSATLPEGYFYDSFYLEPNRGSTAGGTLIELIGMGDAFLEDDRVLFGPSECADLTLVSAGRATCLAPPGALGSVDVTLEHTDGTSITLDDAYEYYDSSDPFDGGLGGGSIEGSLNVTVIDWYTGLPVPEALTILGEDPTTEYQGLTNPSGQITFAGADLGGRQTVHVAKECYERTSFVSFDARDVTIFLLYTCPPPPGSGTPPPSRGVRGAFVSGELVWQGPNEMGPNPWVNVPEPRDGWQRVAYVYTTQSCAGPECRNPAPAQGGANNRVLETPLGIRGYPYSLFVRPAAFAVYAMAGLENGATGEFLPYVMGVARNVLAGPGETVDNVEILMNIPLDHYLDARAVDLPEPTAVGPNNFVVSADVDLGGEGVIVRRSPYDEPLDVVTSRSAERDFRFFAQPALLGELADGRMRVQASWITGANGNYPSTHVRKTGIRAVDAVVDLDGWLGVPVATSPANGRPIPADRVLRWESEGGEGADFYYVQLFENGPGGTVQFWRQFIRGDIQEAPLPNLSSLGQEDFREGAELWWVVYAIQIPGFDFDEVSYADLSGRSWSAWAINRFDTRY